MSLDDLISHDADNVFNDTESFGVSVTYRAADTGDGSAIDVVFGDSADNYLAEPGEQLHQWPATLFVKVSDVSAPARGDSFQVASGPRVGKWYMTGVANADAGLWELNVVFEEVHRTAAENSVEID